MFKSKFTKKEQHLLWLAIIIAVLVVFSFMLKKSQSTGNSSLTQTPSTFSTSQIVAENGQYINSNYGFQFSYDNNFFSKTAEYNEFSQSYVSEENSYLPKLTVSLPIGENIEEVRASQFKKCNQYTVGRSFTDGALVSGTGRKLLANNIGCAYSFTPEGATDIEPSWGILGYFKTPKGIISIGLGFESNEQLVEFTPSFERIFNSFQLLQ